MKTSLVQGPQAEPVTLEEAFHQMRLYVSGQEPAAHPDADYINGLIVSARRNVENVTNRVLMTQTWSYYLDSWPRGDSIEIPYPPLQSVSVVEYTDSAGTVHQLVEGTDYTVDTVSEPGRIVLVFWRTWPTAQLDPNNPIKITFVAGYQSADVVPAEIKQAILLMVSHLYRIRQPVLDQDMSIVPMGYDSLLASYRVWSF